MKTEFWNILFDIRHKLDGALAGRFISRTILHKWSLADISRWIISVQDCFLEASKMYTVNINVKKLVKYVFYKESSSFVCGY